MGCWVPPVWGSGTWRGGRDPQTLGCQILLVWWTPSSWGAGLCHWGGGVTCCPPGGNPDIQPYLPAPQPRGSCWSCCPRCSPWVGGEPPQTLGSPEGKGSAGLTHTHAWAHTQVVAHALAHTTVRAHPMHAHTAAYTHVGTHTCSSAHTQACTYTDMRASTLVRRHPCTRPRRHVHTHMCMHRRARLHMQACAHTCTRTRAHTHLRAGTHRRAHKHTRACTHLCTHTHPPVHAHSCTRGAVSALAPHPSPRPDVLILFVPKAA